MVGLARHLAPGGRLVTGFGLDAEHLPLDEAPFGLDAYDGWCEAVVSHPVRYHHSTPKDGWEP